MTVPLSDAVARSVPLELIERKDIGDLCACMTLATVSERVEKISTSPDWCGGDEELDDDVEASAEVPEGAGRAEEGDGTEDG